MSESDTTTSRGFFAADMDLIQHVVDQGGQFEELAALLVLGCHTPGRGSFAYSRSTAGAHAVSQKAGISRRRAKQALEWLEGAEIISPANDGSDVPRHRKVRWIINREDIEDADLVYLSHTLMTGVGRGKAKPPLARIYSEIYIKIKDGINARLARLDALLLLLHLYKNHSLLDYGGIDPLRLRVTWKYCPDPNDYEMTDINGYDFVTVDRTHDLTTSKEFVAEVFGDLNDQAKARFWHAAHEIKRLGFMYEVLQVWDGDPGQDRNAEVVYPVYVFDGHSSDPGLSQGINKVVTSHMDGSEIGNLFEQAAGDHIFYYAQPTNAEYLAMGNFRLRFRPHTRENGQGIDRQQVMVNNWSHIIADCAA